MKPYQQRVVDEKAELDGKIERLKAFLDGDADKLIDFAEKIRMNRQCGAMVLYSKILGERIDAFEIVARSGTPSEDSHDL